MVAVILLAAVALVEAGLVWWQGRKLVRLRKENQIRADGQFLLLESENESLRRDVQRFRGPALESMIAGFCIMYGRDVPIKDSPEGAVFRNVIFFNDGKQFGKENWYLDGIAYDPYDNFDQLESARMDPNAPMSGRHRGLIGFHKDIENEQVYFSDCEYLARCTDDLENVLNYLYRKYAGREAPKGLNQKDEQAETVTA